MKEQTTIKKQRFCVEVDKRELVNIDLYSHEMKVIAEQLNLIAAKHPESKEIRRQVQHLKKELRLHNKSLEKLRKDCEPEEINRSMQTGGKGEQMRDKSFFEKLDAFENQFKTLRQEANDFVNRYQ